MGGAVVSVEGVSPPARRALFLPEMSPRRNLNLSASSVLGTVKTFESPVVVSTFNFGSVVAEGLLAKISGGVFSRSNPQKLQSI